MEDSSGLVPLDSVGGPRGGGGARGGFGGRGGRFGGGRRPPFRRPPLPPQGPYYGSTVVVTDPGYNAIDPITGEPYYDPTLDTAALAAPAAAPYATGRSRQMLGARAGLGISNLGAPTGRGGFGGRAGFGAAASYGGQGTMIPLGTSAATSVAAPALLRNRLLQQRALQQQAALQQAALTQAALTPSYGSYGSLINPYGALSLNPYGAYGASAAAPLMLMGLSQEQAGEVGSLPGMMSELDGYATYGNPGFAESPPRCWRMR